MSAEDNSLKKKYGWLLSRILGCHPEDLPTLPTTAMELMEMTNQSDASAEDLVKIIRQDPSLAARLMRLANSPAFATGVEVTDLTRAVVVLGFSEIARLAMALTILTAAGGDRPLRRRMQRAKLWWHSQVVGIICDALARDVLDWGGGYYVFGLIHDIGKVALDSHRPEKFTEVLNTIERESVGWVEAENKVLMVDHAFVGLSLLAYWELPQQMVQAVGHHHDPWEAEEHQDIAGMLFLADHLAKTLGYFSFDAEKKIDLAAILDERTSEFLKSRGWALEALRSPEVRDNIEQRIAQVSEEGF